MLGTWPAPLGARLQAAGHEILFGHREGKPPTIGRSMTFAPAAAEAELVIVALPFLATGAVLPELNGLLAADPRGPQRAVHQRNPWRKVPQPGCLWLAMPTSPSSTPEKNPPRR